MFGKGKSKMSGTDKFVMSKGKQAGNFGNTRGGKGSDSGKATPNPIKPRTLTVGKNSRFSAQ